MKANRSTASSPIQRGASSAAAGPPAVLALAMLPPEGRGGALRLPSGARRLRGCAADEGWHAGRGGGRDADDAEAAPVEWWRDQDELRRIATELASKKFVVLDRFVGDADTISSSVRAPSPRVGRRPLRMPLRRSRRTEPAIASLKTCKDELPDELQGEKCKYISCAVTRIAPGGQQKRHVDNLGGRQPAVLTMTYYLQEESWDEENSGGCLRIFESSEKETCGVGDADMVMDVAPRRDRLVVFYSDERVPHAALPVAEGAPNRYASVLFRIDYQPESEGEEDEEYRVEFA